MNYLALILPVIILIMLFIIFKTVLKMFFKLFFYTIMILLLVMSVVGGLVYRDAKNFGEKFTSSDNIFLLEENNKLLAGFILHPGGQPSLIGINKLNEYNILYNGDERDKILEDKYKLLIINTKTFSEEGIVEFDGKQYDRKLVMDILRSDDPVGTYVDGISNSFGLINIDRNAVTLDAGIDEDELKASFFIAMYVSDLGENPINVISNFKKRNIIIYPESIMFKFIKLMPSSVIDSAGLLNENIYKEKITGMAIWHIRQ